MDKYKQDEEYNVYLPAVAYACPIDEDLFNVYVSCKNKMQAVKFIRLYFATYSRTKASLNLSLYEALQKYEQSKGKIEIEKALTKQESKNMKHYVEEQN